MFYCSNNLFFARSARIDSGWVGRIWSCLGNYSPLPACLLIACLSNSQLHAQEFGMDPGMQIDHAVQTRRGNRFFLQTSSTDKSYQLIAVAEQGGLQDSRPFEIVDARDSGKQRYQAGSDNNVSPFFFQWGRSLGSLTATLNVDTSTDAYYYRNQPGLAATPNSPTLRDQPRTVYRQIPGDIGNARLPQLKNSLDDFVHMAFFERDVTTATEFLNDLDSLSYSISLRAGATGLDHPFNYRSGDRSTANLKDRTGSRIVTSLLWTEDRDGNGVPEIYLIEINIGGVSSNPSWQNADSCISDGDSHADLITGQYLILGGQSLLAGQGLPLPAGETRNLTVDWGRILRQLKNRDSATGCRLNATLDHLPNSISLGVALEARGAVQQTLEIAAATAHHENTIPASLVAQEISQSLSENIAEAEFADPDAAQDIAVLTQTASESLPPIESSPPELVIEVAVVDMTINAVTSAAQAVAPGTAVSEPYILGSEIRLPVSSGLRSGNTSGLTWWQILSSSDWSSVCGDINDHPDRKVFDENGVANELSCSVDPGLYSVIEHISGQRWDNMLVLGGSNRVDTQNVIEYAAGELSYNPLQRQLTWNQPGWYQVQRMQDRVSVCESEDSCDLMPGIYQVINHSSGQRWHGIVIPQ